MRRPIGIGLVLIPALFWLKLGCATQEDVNFGDPAKVAGGFIPSTTTATTSSSGGGGGAGGSPACVENAACDVSFADDVFTGIFEAKGSCSSTDFPCHGPNAAKKGLLITAGDAAGAYDAVMGYMLQGADGGKYVEPCQPEASKLLCNLSVTAAEGPNPFGTCGEFLMPLPPGTLLSADELNTVAKWIECGAPNN